MSKAMLTVGACEGGRFGGGAEGLEEGELGLRPRGNLPSRPTQGRETCAHGPGTGAVGHQLTPFLRPLPGGPAETATGQHQRQALERPDEPTDAPHRARR